MQSGLRASSFHLASNAFPPQGTALFSEQQGNEVQAQREQLRRVIASTQLRMLGERGDAVQRLVAAEVHFRQLLSLWRLDFACGEAPARMRAELKRVFNALDVWRACYVALAGSRGGLMFPGDLADPRHYRDMLQMMALLRLFGLRSALAHLDICLQGASLDAVMAALLRGRRAMQVCEEPPAEYALLLRALKARGTPGAAAWLSAYRLSEEGGRTPAEVCAGAAGCPFEAVVLMRLPMWRPTKSVRPRRDKAKRRLAAGVATALIAHEHAVALEGARADAADAVTTIERGLASWYGPGFQDRPTANGERYDMYLLSAAHKTLPLPSFVHVRNLRNGRQLVVVVNDRGPYVDGRVIDLSYAAAQRLGMVEEGVVEVEIRTLSLEQAKALAAAGAPPQPLRDEVREARLPSFAGGLAALAGEAPAAAPINTRTLQAAPQALPELHAEVIAVPSRDIAPVPSLPSQLLVALSSERIEPLRSQPAHDMGAPLPPFAGGLLAWQGPDVPAPVVAQTEPPRMIQVALQWEARAVDPWPQAGSGPLAKPVALRTLPAELLSKLDVPEAQRAEDAAPGPLPTFAGGLLALAPRDAPSPRTGTAVRPKPEAARRASKVPTLAQPPLRSAAPVAVTKPQPAAPVTARSQPSPAAPVAPTGLVTRVVNLAQRSWSSFAGWLGLADAKPAKPVKTALRSTDKSNNSNAQS